MLGEAIGSMLPAALAVALSPFPIIGVVLILASRNGRRNGPLFAIGWAAGLIIVAGITLLLFGGADDAESTTATLVDLLRIAAGGALMVLGFRKGIGGLRSDAVPKTPGWMASLNEASGPRSLLLGLLLSGVNPKSVVLTVAGVTSIIESGVHGGPLLLAIGAFVLVGSCTVVGAVLAKQFGGDRATVFLDGVRGFMLANNAVIMAVVFVILGAKILGDGISGLGS